VPTEDEEAVRDLLRCREDVRADLLRARHRLGKFLLRHGRRYTATTSTWSQRHYLWRRTQAWALPALTHTHEAYLRAEAEAVARWQTVDAQRQAVVMLEPLRERVRRLRCFRGMDDITALTIAAELGDARRFPSARGLMAYVGLIPSEHSSGAKRARGPITKTGNAHVRRVLVEAAWHYRHHPFIGKQLRRRQVDGPETARIIGWRAQQRLYRRYHRLAARGKPKQPVVTAIARERTGVVWASLTQ